MIKKLLLPAVSAAAIVLGALAIAGLGLGVAHADGNQTCTVTDWGVRTNCSSPHGSYEVCKTSLGTAGTCLHYPAPTPYAGRLLLIRRPVPGVPPAQR